MQTTAERPAEAPAPAHGPAGEPPPRRHPITVQEYFRMGETGVLAPDARIELLEGEIIDMTPIGPPHASLVTRINRLLERAVEDAALVSPQNPITLGERSAPQPDIALLRPRDDFYASAHPGPADILLLVEVADSSLAYDRDEKLPVYARFRIPEVWIIDIRGGHLDIHRDPDGERYTTQWRASDLSGIGIAELPDIRMDLGTLFDVPRDR
jgi:Uma2 family endonuclease